MSRISLWSVAIAVLLLRVSSLPAAMYVLQDSIDDYEAQRRSNNTPLWAASENNGVARVGHQTNFNGTGTTAPGGIMPLFFFQLPVLGTGESITGASFGVGLLPDSASTAVTPTFNGDLYALGVVDVIGKTVENAEKFWYIGNTAQAALPAVAGSSSVGGSVSRVADDFLLPTDFIANGGTADVAPIIADVTTYLQNLYADPVGNNFTPGTSYLVMRVNPDADPPPTSGTQRYSLAWQGTVGNGGAGAPETRPLITIETIPEPSSAALAALSVLGWLATGRRTSSC